MKSPGFRLLYGLLTVMFVAALLPAVPAAAVSLPENSGLPPDQTVPAGKWEGYFERTLVTSNSVSGVYITATSMQRGEMKLNVSGGNVTGTVDPVEFEMTYEFTGPSPSSGWCKGQTSFNVTGGSATMSGGLPVFTLQFTASGGSMQCNPSMLEDTISNTGDSVVFTASSYANGKASGSDIAFSPDWFDFAVGNLNQGGASVSTDEYWELNCLSPELLSIDGKYHEYFLHEVSATNTYQAQVDWRSNAPGRVEFNLAGNSVDGVISGSSASADFDLGELPSGENMLAVTAYAADSSPSEELTMPVTIVPLEPWAQKLDFASSAQGDHILYEGEKSVPEKPMQAYVSIPDMIPYVGGQWGLLPTQIKAGVSANSLGGEQKDEIKGSGGFAIGEDVHTLEVEGETYTSLSATQLEFLEDKSIIDLGTQPFVTSKHYGLLSLIPGASQLFNLPVFGTLLESINSISGITGTLTADVSGDLHVGPNDNHSDLTVTRGTMESNLAVKVGVPLNLGLVYLGVSGGGDGYLKMDVAPQPKVLDCWVNLLFEAYAGVADFFGVAPAYYSKEWQVASCQAVTGGLQSPGHLASPSLFSPGVQLIERPDGWQQQVMTYEERENRDVSEITLVENGGKASQPVVALAENGMAALVWAGEDGSKERSNSMEIYARLRTADGTWGDAVQISTDDMLDFNPVAAFDTDGNLLVVWNRNTASFQGEEVSFDEDFARSLEIAYALLDGGSGSVLQSGQVTTNDKLDYMPRLAAGGKNLWLVWQSSAANNLVGSSQQKNSFMAAQWKGGNWSKNEEVVSDLQGTLFYDLAASYSGEAMLVYDRDMDGDLGSGDDREIMLVTHNGRRWGGPLRLTENDVPDTAAHAAYQPNGKPLLAWMQADHIVGLDGDFEAEPQVWLDRPLGAAFSQAVMLAGSGGQRALVWLEGGQSAVDVWLSQYDPQQQSWSEPQVLFAQDTLKTTLSAALTADGEALVGVAQFPLQAYEKEMSDGTMLELQRAAVTGSLDVAELPQLFEALAEEEYVSASSGAMPLWVWVAVVVLLLAVGFVLVMRRRQKPTEE